MSFSHLVFTKDIVIHFFNLYELFPAFICANNIGSQVKNLLKVKVFNFPSFTSFSSHSGGIGGKSVDFSSVFVVSDDSSLSLFLVVSSDS